MSDARDEGLVREAAREVFEALERATPSLVSALAPAGIIGTDYVVGFVHPFSIYVWLITGSDAERDGLPGEDPFLDEVRSIIQKTGLPSEHGSIDGTAVQSQETVDRDYEGSWSNALR